MSYDGRLLRAAHEKLDRAREKNEAMYGNRLLEVYRLCPRVEEIDRQLRALIAGTAALAFRRGEDPSAALQARKQESLELQAERAELLTEAGFRWDYTDPKPLCPHCKDTGYLPDGTVCRCLANLYKQEQNRELSSLLNIGRQTFDAFNLDLYSDLPDPETGISPRENMETVYETCVSYARRFGEKSPNLFFSGGTGLGKTFLAACIAKVVSERGYSVIYATAFDVLRRFEEERFRREESEDEPDTRRYLGCDLLILDDLGTEYRSGFVVSALYHLINTRLAAGKKTIITSNLRKEELALRYSPQIASRLEGEYLPLRFTGEDIRTRDK